MTRAALLSALMLLAACNSSGTPNPEPPAPPPPGTLMTLELSLKPIPCNAVCNQAPANGEFWVGKGQSVKLIVTAKQLSPLAKKVRLDISASGAFLEVSPKIVTLEAGASTEVTVALDAKINELTEPVPYWFIYGIPLGDNDRDLDDQIRLDFRWNLKFPPVATP